MSLQRPSFFNAKILSICFLNISLLSCIPVQAESLNRPISTSPIFAAPPPPEGTGEPGKRSEAGSRGCNRGMNKKNLGFPKKLTAIVPFYPSSESVYGVTTEKYPSFWFYVPYTSNVAYGEFVLEDESEQPKVYPVSLTKTPGIVNLRLPSTSQSLQIGKQHRWYFNVYCKDDKQIIGNVEGYIATARLNPRLRSRLNKAPYAQRVKLYGANGIWYEALDNAAKLRRRNPQDNSWEKLLREVGLSNLANQPMVNCCRLVEEK